MITNRLIYDLNRFTRGFEYFFFYENGDDLSEKEYKVSDIQPSYITISFSFVDEDREPIKLDLSVEDDAEVKDVETDSDGKADVTVIGDDAKVLLVGKSQNG